MPGTTQKLCTALWDLERALDLIDREIFAIHYWPLIRMDIYYGLSEALGIYDIAHPSTRRGWRYRLGKIAGLGGDLIANPWRFSGPRPTVLLPHPRKHRRDHHLVDIYSHRLVCEIAGDGLLILDNRDGYAPQDMPAGSDARSNGLLSVMAKLSAARHHLAFEHALKADYHTIDTALHARLGTGMPITLQCLARRVALFQEMRRLYRSVLAKAKAKRLFLVVAYYLPEAVAAAHDLGIPAYELQHGTITPYHLGYSYPGRPQVPYAPDRLLVFGRHWAESTPLPSNTSAAIIGSDNLDYYKSIPAQRHPRRVVVLSQGVIGERLFDFMVQAARRSPDWHFIFRLHPSERKEAFEERLATLKAPAPNIRISGRKEDFFGLLASAEVQLGVFSTGLFEGMAFGVRTILVPLPGLEYMTPVLERGDAVLAHTPEDVAPLLNTAPAVAETGAYYARPVSSIMNAALEGSTVTIPSHASPFNFMDIFP